MTDKPPIRVSEPEWERGLWGMVAASGALHLVGIALLVLIPHTFLHHPPPLHSYTVDLIAPDKLGGTNSIAGGKGRVEAPSMAAVPKAEKPPPQPPPPAKVEVPLPPKPEVEPPEPPKEVAKAEPPKPPEPPKPEPQPKEDEIALAAKVKPAPPTVAPVPTAASKPVPSPQTRAAPTPHVKPAPTVKAVAKAAPTVPSKAELAKQKEAEAKAKQADAKAKEATQRDERIAAAIRRVEQQAGERGGGSGTKTTERAGGPISSGPGEGAGGTVMGVEFVIYKNQLEQRIKEKWAWVGSDQNLEATIHLSITPEGEVVDVHIIKSSGDPSYDRSVERAVKAINPLPPPPEAYRRQFSDVEYTFTPKSLQM